MQISFFDVERMRAEPNPPGHPIIIRASHYNKVELATNSVVVFVVITAVSQGPTLTEVVAASLHGPPPADPKVSTGTCWATESVDVQENSVARAVSVTTPGTE